MNKYIVTHIVGDTYNIPTYDVISCEEKNLVQILDKNYYDWRTRNSIKIFVVSKEIDKEELKEASI